MPWIGAALLGGAGIISGLIGGNASTEAANTQSSSANAATQAELGMFNQTQANLQPWMAAGTQSLAQLQAALGMPGATTPGGVARHGPAGQGVPAGTNLTSILQNTPGYQWTVGQGQQSILDQASALGGTNSGATLKALSDYTSNQANTTYEQYIQNLMSQSGAGQNAAANLGGFAASTGGQIGSNLIGSGNAQAAGQIGTASALTGGANSAFNNYLLMSMLQNNPYLGGGGSNYMGQMQQQAPLS